MKKAAGIQNFENMSEGHQRLFMDMVKHYSKEYIRNREEIGAISTAVGFHDLLDEEIDMKKSQIKPSCFKGCSFCCHIRTEITQDEAKLLIEFSKEENISINRELLIAQRDHSEENWSKLSFQDRKCVFLSDQGECKVYKHRPGVCRKYYVASDPSLCDLDNTISEEVQVIVNTKAEIVFISSGVVQEVGQMSNMLLNEMV